LIKTYSKPNVYTQNYQYYLQRNTKHTVQFITANNLHLSRYYCNMH